MRNRIVFDQIAIAVPDPEKAMRFLAKLGFNAWAEDVVTASGRVGKSEGVVNVAHLAFNYQLFETDRKVEFEIIKYHTGDNFHWKAGFYPDADAGISHIGYHCDDMIEEKERFRRLGVYPIQEVKTISHSNPDLPKTRSYHYVIFDTAEHCGFYIKAIKRISE